MPIRTYTIEAIDASGQPVTLEVTEAKATPKRTFEGRKVAGVGWVIKTQDGRDVKRLSKGKYQIEGTGEELMSDDPNAP